jgi:hypothetical protein
MSVRASPPDLPVGSCAQLDCKFLIDKFECEVRVRSCQIIEANEHESPRAIRAASPLRSARYDGEPLVAYLASPLNLAPSVLHQG